MFYKYDETYKIFKQMCTLVKYLIVETLLRYKLSKQLCCKILILGRLLREVFDRIIPYKSSTIVRCHIHIPASSVSDFLCLCVLKILSKFLLDHQCTLFK